jgi:hypothetical protein
MTESEGVIQYRLQYRPGSLPPDADYPGLFRWFGQCRRLGLIGRDPALYGGLAYGNISVRAGRGFVISGTQTGARETLSPQDLAWVEDFDAGRNRLSATGPARPSSEAMTHGQVYRRLPGARAVIHIHSATIWHQARRLGLPSTAAEAGYGTPEMAAEVDRLLSCGQGDSEGAFAMGGHEDGVATYAPDMDTAGGLLLDLLSRAKALDARRSRIGRQPRA